MLRNILSNLEGDASTTYGQERPVERACIVVVTSNRGLCGAFNANVCKAAVLAIETKYAGVRAKGNLDILCIGKRGTEFFKKRYSDCRIIDDHMMLFEDLSSSNVGKVSGKLMEAFVSKQYDAVEVAYGRFRNAAMQFAEVDRWLPVAKLEVQAGASTMKADYIFEPTKEGLLEYLVPSILKTQFQKFLLDTHASEHGARMTSMDKATENANDLLRDLRIHYNKARQETITNEILEIVGGAAALSSD
jgi:F-type H+-transporting ATPase subunit gamma